MSVIDLRSDTVTQPTPGMRAAMADAPSAATMCTVKTPAVNTAGGRTGQAPGLRCGAVRAYRYHEQPVGADGPLRAGRGIHRRPAGPHLQIRRRRRGGAGFDPAAAAGGPGRRLAGSGPGRRAAIKPDDFHFARTRLLALENTMQGKVLPISYLAAARAFTREHGLALHLDGARLYNAAVKLGVDAREITQPLRLGFGVPVQGPWRAGWLGAVRLQCELDRQGPSPAQDGRRRHAPGRLSWRRPGCMRWTIRWRAWPTTMPMPSGWATSCARQATDVEPVQTNMVYVQIGEQRRGAEGVCRGPWASS
jgi:threonine aldolase